MVARGPEYALVAVVLLASVVVAPAHRLKEQHAWYHTSDEIHAELSSLSSSCSGAKLSISKRTYQGAASQPSVELDVVHISQGSTTQGKQKAFFVFGEHARELISPESGLHLVRLLCGGGDSTDQDLVQQVLRQTTFVIIPNANPLGRRQVEMGQYCKRTNEAGVDLNRNWPDNGAQHQRGSSLGLDDEVNPGPHAFSEPETKMLRDILAEEKPDVFLSVHSGAYLLGMPPFKSKAVKDTQSQQQTKDVLARISQEFCDGDCPFGDLTDVIGYKSQGCDIDYVKNYLHTPYAFTWEIYANPDIRKFFAEKAHARAEKRELIGAAKTYFSMKSLMLLETHEHANSARQLRGHAKLEGPDDDAANDECFEEFNPTTQDETEQVLTVWGSAFLSLCIELKGISSVKKSAH